MMTTNVPLLRAPAEQGTVPFKLGPICVVSFDLFSKQNSLLRGGFEVPPHQYFL